MERVEMTLEETKTKAILLFLGKVYFCSQGGFNYQEFVQKMEKEFQILKLESYNGDILGSASLFSPTITIYKKLGQDLDSYIFSNNISEYRSVALHELIHKFLIIRDKEGHILSSGLHIILNENKDFREYLGKSLVNTILEKLNPLNISLFKTGISKYDFGVGANEGYTEWFRASVLKNDEKLTYEKLWSVFQKIQMELEKKNLDALEIMKNFKNGNYEYIFRILNFSKEVGVLFIRYLDFLYVKEYEEEQIREYLENKKLQKKLERLKSESKLTEEMEKILQEVCNFCSFFEKRVREKTNRILSEEEILNISHSVLNKVNGKLIIFHSIERLLDQSFHKESKLEIKDIQNLNIFNITKIEYFLNQFLNEINYTKYIFSQSSLRLKHNIAIQFDKMKIKNILNLSIKKTAALSGMLLLGLFVFLKYNYDKNDNDIKIEDIVDENNDLQEVIIKNSTLNGEDLTEDSNAVEEEKTDIYTQYFYNEISLEEGQEVYETSYDTIAVNMKYAYQNLDCNAVRIIKGNEIIEEGLLEDIDRFYIQANLIGANVRLRLVQNNENGTSDYIAWLDLQDAINYINNKNNVLLTLKKHKVD